MLKPQKSEYQIGKRKWEQICKPTFYDAAIEATLREKGKVPTLSTAQNPPKHDPEDVFSLDSAEWNESLTEDELNTPFAYTILVTIVLILSTIGLGVSYDLHFFEDKSYDFIYLERGFPKTPAYLMFMASALGILTGITGLLIIFCGWPFLFHIFHHTLWMISALNLLSALYAMGIRTEPTTGVYHRLFEASSLALMDDFTYIDIWGEEYRFIWNLIQKELKCCGVHDPEDWLRSPLKQIPRSCCSHYHIEKCETRLRVWNDLPENNRNYDDISSLLNLEGCLDSVRVEWKAMRWDWVVYPIIVFIFHTLTTINLTLLTKVLESQFRTVIGQDILKEFRRYVKSKLTGLCCYPCKIFRNLCKSHPPNQQKNDASTVITLHQSTRQSPGQVSSETSSTTISMSSESISSIDPATARKQRKVVY